MNSTHIEDVEFTEEISSVSITVNQEVETIESSWLDDIDFKRIVRVKGKEGLFSLISNPNKSGMIFVAELFKLTPRTYPIHINKIEILDSFSFKTNNLSVTLNIIEVFKNIDKIFEESAKDDFDIENENDRLAIQKLYSKKDLLNDVDLLEMVPDADLNEFKNYHAVKVFKWYFWLKFNHYDFSKRIDN